ncbi:hypothetical protein SteCoe_14915 [Stentor coeruleus]|uniref:TNFR-Cys domain-containing protein n=1 Tax=Stentor coeruleus TaxID=5963 RepID=A0A1R2C4V9_9CILI|nr:hypothetical protein SteCoe_14915 [Stentor coeruleus]
MNRRNFISLSLIYCAFAMLDCLSSSDSKCISCSSYLLSPVCTRICPSGYTAASFGKCSLLEAYPKLFFLDFSSETNLQLNSISSFYTPSNISYINSLKSSPLPTLDRGFYFSNNSTMATLPESNSSFIPSPNLTVKMWIKVISKGKILSSYIGSSYTYCNIYSTDSELIFEVSYCKKDSLDCGNTLPSLPLAISKKWQHMMFNVEFTYKEIILTGYKDKNLGINIVLGSSENSIGKVEGNFTWVLGNSIESFEGFLYMLEVDNWNNVVNLVFVDPPNCLSGEYWDGECLPCMKNCGDWPWCVRDTDCSYCFSNVTESCYGYKESEVISGVNCVLGCVECYNTTACLKAQYGNYVLRKNYKGEISDTISSNISIDMTNLMPREILQSGSNDNTDYFNSPDLDDYTPIPCRGFYFSGGQFGATRLSQVIPSTFSLSFWLKGKSGPILSKSSKLIVFADGSLQIELINSENSISSTIVPANPLEYLWSIIIFNIEYSNFDTTITRYINNTVTFQYTYENQVFRDTRSIIYIGKNSSDYYIGFIMYCGISSLFQDYSTILSDFYPLPCIISTCDYYQALDIGCSNCTSGCTGCYLKDSCGVCYDLNCLECYTIYECIICKPGYTLNEGSCVLYNENCIDKYLSIGCSKCSSEMIMLDGHCLSKCPTGYFNNTGSCVLEDNKILDIDFKDIIILDTIGLITVGKNNSNVYPEIDPYDPYPMKNRGYYFSSSSMLQVSIGTIFSHNFTIASWIKAKDYGSFISKGLVLSNILIKVSDYLVSTDIFNINQGDINFSGGVDLSTWAYLEVTIEYSPYTYSTTLTFFKNIIVENQYTKTFFAFTDQWNNEFYIGNNPHLSSEYGFTGFLWSLEIYNSYNRGRNYYTVGCLGCSLCASHLICPGNCSHFESDPTCASCSTCSYGCNRVTDCNLCHDANCETCLSFSTCKLCRSRYYLLDNACFPCHSSCQSCTNSSYTSCITCLSNYLYFPNYSRCLKYSSCSTGYEINSNLTSCLIIKSTPIFKVQFNKLKGIFIDSISNLSLQSGNSTSFYPNYESSDILAAKDRGLYFNTTSYMQILTPTTSNLILSPNFTFSLWVMIISDGNLFTRSYANNVYINLATGQGIKFSILIENTTKSCQIISTQYYFKWHLIQITKEIYDDGERISVYVDEMSNSQIYSSYYEDPIYNISSIFGDPIKSFQGFMYEITISNSLSLVNFMSSSKCIYPYGISHCLPTCLIDYFYSYDTGTCKKCLSKCNYCSYSTHCNLCYDSLCLECEDYVVCSACKSNSTYTNGKCVCNTGYGYHSKRETCLIITDQCFEGCKYCIGLSVFECVECKDGYFFIEGICEKIPTGYNNSTNPQAEATQILLLIFNGLEGLVLDKINSIPALTGKSESFYPDYDNEDPLAAYLRGYYFDGKSSIVRLPEYKNYTSNPLILPPSYTFEIWILPTSDGTFLYSSSPTTLLFNISLNDLHIILTFYLEDIGIVSYNSSMPVFFNSWYVLLASLNYTQSSSSISLYINNIYDGTQTIPEAIFVNVFPNTFITIGASYHKSYFSGFIYSVSFYLSYEITQNRQLVECSAHYNGICLPECLIDEYWVGPEYNHCGKCMENCKKGCRNYTSCNLCYNPLCKYCFDYQEGCKECIDYAEDTKDCKCIEGSDFDEIQHLCYKCIEGEYYNGTACEKCSTKCAKCDKTTCFSCMANAELNGNDCICSIGYNGTNSCTESSLNMTLILSSNNNIILVFSSNLTYQLNISSFSLSACVSIVYGIQMWSPTKYYIEIAFDDKVPLGCEMILEFQSATSVLSVYNGILKSLIYKIQLYEMDASDSSNYQALMASAEKTSAATTRGTTSATISFSMSNPNPACLWSFINVIQMICFIRMSSVPLTPKFSGYLKGLKKYNMFPNIFEYFVPDTGQKKPFKKAYDFGYKTNLLLLNSGSYISAFLFTLSLLFLFLILNRFSHKKPLSISFIKEKITSTLKNYKYGTFVRFWITCYMELFAAALIALIMFDTSTPGLIINLIVSIIIIIVIIATPIVFFDFTYKNREKISDSNEEITANWGTLFYEFSNDKGLGSSQFYFFFFTRRILYIVIQFSLQSFPIVQLSLNTALSVANLFYLLVFRPFTEIVLNITNPICEIGILIIFILTSISMLDIPDTMYDQLDDILVFFVNFIMFVQMGSSIAVFIKNVIMIIKMKIKKRKEEAEKKAKDKMMMKVAPLNTKPEAISSNDEENSVEILEEKMHPPSAEVSYHNDYTEVAVVRSRKLAFHSN